MQEEAIAWFLDEARLERAHGGVPGRLAAWSDAGSDLDALLDREGFAPDPDGGYVHRAIRLRGTPTDPDPVDGYVLFGVSLDGDLGRRVEVHRAAFDPSRMTIERYGSVMGMPLYRPELDVVAVAPDGTFAAFCLAWYDPETRVGLFEPVGTHPDHRRRGLAAAVCREALRRLAAVGAEGALGIAKAGTRRLAKDMGVLQRIIQGFGLVDLLQRDLLKRKRRRGHLQGCPCSFGEECTHTWTHRHPGSDIPYQDDYLFASHALAERMDRCRAVDFADDATSDHAPIVATFS